MIFEWKFNRVLIVLKMYFYTQQQVVVQWSVNYWNLLRGAKLTGVIFVGWERLANRWVWNAYTSGTLVSLSEWLVSSDWWSWVIARTKKFKSQLWDWKRRWTRRCCWWLQSECAFNRPLLHDDECNPVPENDGLDRPRSKRCSEQ
jgi:hypothetical protein